MKIALLSSILVVIFLFMGCNGECCQKETLITNSIDLRGNETPIAIISDLPTEAACGTSMTANASSSSDHDGSIQSYRWTLDGQPLANTQSSITPAIPCDDTLHTVCLTVVDNEGLPSEQTCQNITVDLENITPPTIQPQPSNRLKPPTPIITFEKADSNQYKFFCLESHDNDTIDTDGIDNTATNNIVKCTWSVAKEFLEDGNQETHGTIGAIKWVNVNPETFKSINVTLTVTDDDGETNTTTQHYFLPQDLPL